MGKRRRWNRKARQEMAERRIERLFERAEVEALQDRFDLADRYVELARKLSMRYLVGIPRQFKRRFCKHCYRYLLPSVNSRVRVHRGRVVVYCEHCGKYSRFPLKDKKE